MKTQYQYNNREVVLEVKKASLMVRMVLYILVFLCVALPVVGIVGGVVSGGEGMSILSIVLFAFILFLGYFVFRLALWNTFGKEEISFGKEVIYYQADYGWFKDKRKKYDVGKTVKFAAKQMGYQEDNKGVLTVEVDMRPINSAVKMPMVEVEQLIKELKKLY